MVRLDGDRPVSYTHLDVYKRQIALRRTLSPVSLFSRPLCICNFHALRKKGSPPFATATKALSCLQKANDVRLANM